jgi:hypothetical protein
MLSPTSLLPWEVDSYAPLDWIPQAVRFKLDGIGAKIGLKQWQDLTMAHRQNLLDLPIESLTEKDAWRNKLHSFLAADKAGNAREMTPVESWKLNVETQEQWKSVGYSLTPETWSKWNEFERFLAMKTAFSKSSQVPMREIAQHLGLTPD